MEIIFFLFVFAALAQLFYFLFIFSRLLFYKSKELPEIHPSVSVIICARNEAANLDRNLHYVLQQKYPEFEVVLVNDNSEDQTSSILTSYQSEYNHLRVVNLTSKKMEGKKEPLLKGIEAAAFNTLLLTDADCKPASRDWISGMIRPFQDPDKKIVLGYGPNKKENNLVNDFFRFETFFVAIQYFSFALAGWPYMGVGRNLAYKKDFFTKYQNFAEHDHLPSGDDDLFINKVATAQNTAISTNPDTFTYSPARNDLKSWLKQKRRHHSTGASYRWKFQIALGLFYISHFMFYFAFILLILFGKELSATVLLFLMIVLIKFLLFYLSAKKLQEINIGWKAVFFDFIYSLFYLKFVSAAFSDKKTPWK